LIGRKRKSSIVSYSEYDKIIGYTQYYNLNSNLMWLVGFKSKNQSHSIAS